MSQLPVQPYERAPSAFHPWDPRTADVARELARLIASARPGTVVEHIGSSAVPGLPGKNVVDLGIEADPDEIPALSDALRSLGFGPQGGLAPFPPARPMLTGNVVHDGTSFRVHCHVIPPARGELRELIAFRDALRADPSLRDGYAEAKRRIVEAAPDGEANQLYTARKSDFVQDALYGLGIRHGPADAPEPLAPGATVGVMGGGQLGRMLGLAARAMGYRLVVLDPDPELPGVRRRRRGDRRPLRRRGRRPTARRGERCRDLRAGARGPRRGRGRRRAAAAPPGAPRPARRPRTGSPSGSSCARSGSTSRRSARSAEPPRRGPPPTTSATRSGSRSRSAGTTAAASCGSRVPPSSPAPWRPSAGTRTTRCCSSARSPSRPSCPSCAPATEPGAPLAFPVARNRHDRGILAETVAPAPVHPIVAFDAAEIADSIARGLDLVGVLTVELFQLPAGGGLMVNELAPRVHNSGHWSIEGAATSQFEQHLRAILGLPLGSVAPHGVVGDGQPAGLRARIATRASRASSGPWTIPVPTSTSTASAGCSSGARWAT